MSKNGALQVLFASKREIQEELIESPFFSPPLLQDYSSLFFWCRPIFNAEHVVETGLGTPKNSGFILGKTKPLRPRFFFPIGESPQKRKLERGGGGHQTTFFFTCHSIKWVVFGVPPQKRGLWGTRPPPPPNS